MLQFSASTFNNKGEDWEKCHVQYRDCNVQAIPANQARILNLTALVGLRLKGKGIEINWFLNPS